MSDKTVLRKLLTVGRNCPVPDNCWFAVWAVRNGAPKYGLTHFVEQYTDQDAAYAKCLLECDADGNASRAELVQVVNGTETRMWVADNSVWNLPLFIASGIDAWDKPIVELIRGRLMSSCDQATSQSCLTT